jgi:hypothetical protein
MVAVAVSCLFLAVFPGLAQSSALLAEQQESQNRRLDQLEHLGIEKRLTTVETQAAEMSWELRTMLAGVGGLVIEAAFRIGRRKVVK